MMSSIFGCFSSDVGMKANSPHKIWVVLAPHLCFGARWPLPLTCSAVLSQACECNTCQQLHCIYIYFLFIRGTWTVKDFSSPCCNAACQFGSLVYTRTRPLPFLTRSNVLCWHVCQQVWSGVKRHAAQKWRSCHIGWTSRSWDGTSRGIVPAACTQPVGTRVPMRTGSPPSR